ncbi:heat stress transcription factor A-1 [Elaeis guineensis]|uniref:Heat stress transcription factor A-1 n=1 Tax=Elaeis guineensis var. tenera TaxID=51953 RepID=A0A6I9QKP8_ELAGV|nr:heat stress transcription factor A-1 [Elaeis guineensis]
MGDNAGNEGGAADVPPAASGANAGLGGNAPPPFLSKTYDMVDDPATDAIVSWGAGNNSFVVWNTPEFARDLLPKYFKHNNFSSFVRQLNTYGFRKVNPDRWEFANEGFLRGQKHLLKTINRRKPGQTPSQAHQPQVQSTNLAACVEVGKFGLEEEIERLKRDKNVLMQELVRLRQQQQGTDRQLQTLGQRLKGMEQRQQQMMSFLAKAMQSPGFLAQLVQQNDSNWHIAGMNKKRRLPMQDNKQDGESLSPDGQIIKYQPLMNEAAKVMLMQILNLDTSPRLESLGNSENFLIENIALSPQAFDGRSSSNQNLGVTLSEVPTTSGTAFLPPSSGFSAICSSSMPSEIQSSAGVADMVTATELADLSVLSRVPDAIDPQLPDTSIPEFSQMEGVVPNGNAVGISSGVYVQPEAENIYMNPISAGMDEQVSIETEKFSSDTDVDIFTDEEQKLPSINDSFWEQFLIASPLSGDAEDVDSSIYEAKEMQPEQENGWDNAQSMDHLTEKMGLLASQRK